MLRNLPITLFLLSGLMIFRIDSFRGTVRKATNCAALFISETDGESARTFASYSIYKGKGAVSLKIIPPTLVSVQSLNGASGKTVDRDGAVLFEFALPKPGAIKDSREYDWNKKSSFSLSATECGDILCMDITEGKEFLHDPNMGSKDAGIMTKKMRWAPTPDFKGMFLSLQVSDKSPSNLSGSYSVSLTMGELQVIRSILEYSIPRLLAFDRIWDNKLSMNAEAPVVSSTPKYAAQPRTWQ